MKFGYYDLFKYELGYDDLLYVRMALCCLGNNDRKKMLAAFKSLKFI